MSDPAHKCYSRHAQIESVKTKKRQKVKYYLRQEKGKEKEGKLFYEVQYMQSFVVKGN